MDKTKKMMRVALIAILALAAQSAAAALEIHFESNAVRITGGVRGGRVVCTFIDRAPHDAIDGSLVVADTDNDGEVRVPFPEALSDHAVWIAVDFETGEIAAAMRDGAVRDVTFRGHSFRTGGGESKQLESHDFKSLDVLVVRPRAGAWELRGSDGGPGDSDGRQDLTLVVDVESLRPLQPAFGPPPKKFEKGDVVVLLDPETSDVFTSGVSK